MFSIMRRSTWQLAIVFTGLALAANASIAQTPSAEAPIARAERLADIGPGALPANSRYLGAQVAYMFGDGEEFMDGLLAALAFTYIPKTTWGAVKLPFLANVDIGELLGGLTKDSLGLEEARKKVESIGASRRGVVGGFYPYLIVGDEQRVALTIHGMVGYKGNFFAGSPGENASETKAWLHQARLSAGVELRVKLGEDPATFGIAPTYHAFNAEKYAAIFGERRSGLRMLEAHAVIPLSGYVLPNGARVALMAEGIFGGSKVFGDQSLNGIRAGVLLLKKQ